MKKANNIPTQKMPFWQFSFSEAAGFALLVRRSGKMRHCSYAAISIRPTTPCD